MTRLRWMEHEQCGNRRHKTLFDAIASHKRWLDSHSVDGVVDGDAAKKPAPDPRPVEQVNVPSTE